MQTRRARSDRVDLVEIADVNRVSRSHAGHRARAKKDLGGGLCVAAVVGDVNELESVGDSGSLELGSLLGAIAVGDDSEAMPAQFSERRKDVGKQRPTRFVDAKVDVKELVRLRVGQVRANRVAHPRSPLILVTQLARQEPRKIGLHRRHPRRMKRRRLLDRTNLLVERVHPVADSRRVVDQSVVDVEQNEHARHSAFERSCWQFAQYAHTLAAVLVAILMRAQRAEDVLS